MIFPGRGKVLQGEPALSYGDFRWKTDQGADQGRVPEKGLFHRGVHRPPDLWLSSGTDG